MIPSAGDVRRICFQLGAFRNNTDRSFGGPTQGHESFGHRVHEALDFLRYAVEQFMQVAACLADAQQAFGRVDGVAKCVGSLLLKPAHLTTDSEWHTTLATNLTTAFATVQAGARTMLSTGGSIVLVSSAAARVGLANHEAIAAAKAGIIGLTLAAAASRKYQLPCYSLEFLPNKGGASMPPDQPIKSIRRSPKRHVIPSCP